MPNIGPIEVLVVLILVGLPIAIIVMVAVAVSRSRARSAQSSHAPSHPVAPPGPPQTAPAAWYADPNGQSRLRYWDGAQWTEHVAN